MPERKLRIAHISHGITATGGFRHEQFLMARVCDHFSREGVQVEQQTIRAHRFFRGISNLRLLWWGFTKPTADINIVVARVALAAIVRNLFSERKVLVVLHYFDKRDGKGRFLSWYYAILFLALSTLPLKNTAVVVVAPFWVTYFENKFRKNVPVFLFPNFFDVVSLSALKTPLKKKQVHLGQYSFKNDPRIFGLAKQLHAAGFRCYFSTMLKQEAGFFDGYEVVWEDRETYLHNMSQSAYTLAFIGVNEGWNRVAHESVLMGTPVIGNNAGGLGDLLKESGSMIANTEDEFMDCILSGKTGSTSEDFIKRYNEPNAGAFLGPVVGFLSR